jgi:hypothetical protein
MKTQIEKHGLLEIKKHHVCQLEIYGFINFRNKKKLMINPINFKTYHQSYTLITSASRGIIFVYIFIILNYVVILVKLTGFTSCRILMCKLVTETED